MSDMKDIGAALVRTNDGRSVLFWALVFTLLLIYSIVKNGLELEQWKYIGFSAIAFAIFCRFRGDGLQPDVKTNMWCFININGFCLFLMYKEFL